MGFLSLKKEQKIISQIFTSLLWKGDDNMGIPKAVVKILDKYGIDPVAFIKAMKEIKVLSNQNNT